MVEVKRSQSSKTGPRPLKNKDKTDSRLRSKGKVIALTGVNGFIGNALLHRLGADSRYSRIVAIDKKKPAELGKKTKFYRVNITETLADEKMANIFAKEGVEQVVHCAFPITPLHDSSKAHELQSIGTMYLLNACAAQAIEKLILSSTTDVYGAHATNPNYLSEKHPARGGVKSPFIRDKIDAENQVLTYARRRPKTVVTILRPCTVLGPRIHNFKTKFVQRPVIFTIMGYDPLLQFVHENDVMKAFEIVLHEDHPGIYNIVGEGVMPLSKALHLAGKVSVPVPSFILYPVTDLMWNFDLFPGPASHLDFLKYLCVADGRKAETELGFKPTHTSRKTLLSFIGAERLRRAHLLEEGAVSLP